MKFVDSMTKIVTRGVGLNCQLKLSHNSFVDDYLQSYIADRNRISESTFDLHNIKAFIFVFFHKCFYFVDCADDIIYIHKYAFSPNHITDFEHYFFLFKEKFVNFFFVVLVLTFESLLNSFFGMSFHFLLFSKQNLFLDANNSFIFWIIGIQFQSDVRLYGQTKTCFPDEFLKIVSIIFGNVCKFHYDVFKLNLFIFIGVVVCQP